VSPCVIRPCGRSPPAAGGSRPQCDAVRREVSKQHGDLSLPAAIRIAQACRVTPDEAEILGQRSFRTAELALALPQLDAQQLGQLTCRCQGTSRHAVTWSRSASRSRS
jgi:hypothetical protein